MVNPLLIIASETAEKEGIAILGIDFKAILLQSGTFLLLFLIIKKFALRGIVDTLENRRKTIDKGVRLGAEMQSAKAKFDEELKAMQHKARLQSDEILVGAQAEASNIIKEAESTASKKVDQMLKDATARIERDMQSARRELRSEMLSLVSEATEVIIGEKIDAKKDASLIERALAKVRT
ncbi:F0F1 ATP synthase subunit B [Candidatus Saccharibacteria bacterium]|nr:F0F1 ATP synthase subunit B [Candidatus Saccharibacteria bacterium]